MIDPVVSTTSAGRRSSPAWIAQRAKDGLGVVLASLGLGAVVWMIYEAGLEAVLGALRAGAFYVPALLALELCGVALDAVAVRALHGVPGRRVPAAVYFRGASLAYLASQVLPGGRVVGEGLRTASIAGALQRESSTSEGKVLARAALVGVLAHGVHVLWVAAAALLLALVVTDGALAGALALVAAWTTVLGTVLFLSPRSLALVRWVGRRTGQRPLEQIEALERIDNLPTAIFLLGLARGSHIASGALAVAAVSQVRLPLESLLASEGIQLLAANVGDAVPGQAGVIEGAFRAFAVALFPGWTPQEAAAAAVVVAFLLRLSRWLLAGSLGLGLGLLHGLGSLRSSRSPVAIAVALPASNRLSVSTRATIAVDVGPRASCVSFGMPMKAGLPAGARLGNRYRIDAPLAVGGMGMIYRARDEQTQTPVAIKVLLPELAEDIDSIRRFEREGKAFSRLTHPGIVRLHDIGRAPNPSGPGMVCFIVMELVLGDSLAQRMARGPLPLEQVLPMGISALEALGAAHAVGITHRDVKPANLMVVAASSPPRIKVLDFGIAQLKTGTVYTRLTHTGVIVGTPLFMSPEQARSEACDARTDLHALGLVLWSCVTGRPPYQGDNIASLVVSVLEEMPPRLDMLSPSVPSELAAIIEKSIQKAPASRFTSAAEFASALQAVQASLSARNRGTQTPPSRAPDAPKAPAWRWAIIVVVALVVGASLLLALGLPLAVMVGARGRGASTPPTSPLPSPSAPGALVPGAVAACDLMVTCCIAAGTPAATCEPIRATYLSYPDRAEEYCLAMVRAHRSSIETMGRSPGACVVP